MATDHERARTELVSRFREQGETADLQARCDASGVTLEEVRASSGVSVRRVDAQGRPRDQLVSGERLVHTGSTHLACGDCSAVGACECRRLDSSSGDTQTGNRHSNTDADDLPPLAFGQVDLTKARAYLGAKRCAKRQRECEAEWEAQNRAARGQSSIAVYRPLLVDVVSAAHPDLAERAAVENIAWLRSQYAALPLPTSNDQTESKTDMAQRDAADEARDRANAAANNAWRQPLGGKHAAPTVPAHATRTDATEARADARRAAHTAHAPTSGEATSLTEAQQQARLDVAEDRFDHGERREIYLRTYRTVSRSDAKGGSGEKRVLTRLQEILDEATDGELSSERAKEAAGLLEKLADLHGAVEESDDAGLPAFKIGRTDASEQDDPTDVARQRMNRRAQNAWREPLNKEGQEQLNIARLARED